MKRTSPVVTSLASIILIAIISCAPPSDGTVNQLPPHAWSEIGFESASGGGISGNAGSSSKPVLALDAQGYPVVVWCDTSKGATNAQADEEIYIKRWDGDSWEEIGTGSASGGGISNNSHSSFAPSLVLDAQGYPVVAWSDYSSGTWQIYIKRWDGDSWEVIGAGSASGNGISNTAGSSWRPSLILDAQGYPVVVWEDNSSNIAVEIYGKRWDGDSWEVITTGSASGNGISAGADGAAAHPRLIRDGIGRLIVVWDNNQGHPWPELVYIKRQNGNLWETLGPHSASPPGLADGGSATDSEYPVVLVDAFNNPHVLWSCDSGSSNEIFGKFWDGESWQSIGTGSAAGGGISANTGYSYFPQAAMADGKITVCWYDYTAGNAEIYLKRWDGFSWNEMHFESASGGGISRNSGASRYPSLALNAAGNPVVAWQDDTSGNSEIYILGW